MDGLDVEPAELRAIERVHEAPRRVVVELVEADDAARLEQDHEPVPLFAVDVALGGGPGRSTT